MVAKVAMTLSQTYVRSGSNEVYGGLGVKKKLGVSESRK